MRPTAPGKPATHSATLTIQSMPMPIPCQSTLSNPNGRTTSANSPHGITQAETIGMANRLASTP
jgi:hypothetical protein